MILGDIVAMAVSFVGLGAVLAASAEAFVVTALNPKGAIFFVAFPPQFVDPASPALHPAGANFHVLFLTTGHASWPNAEARKSGPASHRRGGPFAFRATWVSAPGFVLGSAGPALVAPGVFAWE